MIKINGVPLPTPSTYRAGIMDLSKAERNAAGTIVIDRITTKRKLELTYRQLDKDTLSTLLKAVSPVFFEVEYIDPQDNAFRTGTFYCGDRNVEALDYRNGVVRYRDIKFNLVER